MAKEKDKEIDKDKMLDQVLADIEKQFGKGAIMKLGGQNNMEIDKLDKEIEDLMKKEERLEDMYDELSKTNDVVKTIHNPYRTKRK